MRKPEIKNTFNVFMRPDAESHRIGGYIEKRLTDVGWEKSEKPSIVVAVGGDGTMLWAFKKYYNVNTSFVGLHTGTLGFYADWHKDETDILIENIINTTPNIVQYPLVEVEFNYLNKKKKDKMLALNEFMIRSNNLSTFIMDVHINNEHFESFRGDGIIISTPSGSTAYNYSAHGAVMHPSVEAIQVAELSSLNNAEFRTLNRSFILPKHHLLTLNVKNDEKEILAGVDTTELKFSNVSHINVKVSKNKINFLRYKPLPFWQRVKDKFIK